MPNVLRVLIGMVLFKNPDHFLLELFCSMSTFDFLLLCLIIYNIHENVRSVLFLFSQSKFLIVTKDQAKYDQNYKYKLTVRGPGESVGNLRNGLFLVVLGKLS